MYPKLDRILPGIGRIVIAIPYIWFGGLKLLVLSPASELVTKLQLQTLPFLNPTTFLIILGLGEILIGILWLIPRVTRPAFTFTVLHMITTFLPFVFLPGMIFTTFPGITLEGQYIVKNFALLFIAVYIFSQYKAPYEKNIFENMADWWKKR